MSGGMEAGADDDGEGRMVGSVRWVKETDPVAVHIRHIREKIEINAKEPRYLKVVWGIGYKVEKL